MTENFQDKYPQALVKDLLWCRKYHLMLVKEIDDRLIELSKKHSITIPLDN